MMWIGGGDVEPRVGGRSQGTEARVGSRLGREEEWGARVHAQVVGECNVQQRRGECGVWWMCHQLLVEAVASEEERWVLVERCRKA